MIYRFVVVCLFLCVLTLNSYKPNIKDDKTSLTLMAVGDALLHKGVYEDAKTIDSNKKESYDFYNMLSLIKPIATSHDLAFYNQESILGGTKLGLSSYPAFNSPQEFGLAMLDSGFNLVSLANNHTLDRGEKAIASSLRFWRDKGVLTAGSYESFSDRQKDRIFTKNGITYGMLAYTYGTNGIPLPTGKEYLVNIYNKEMLKKDILALRPKVDLLIVSMHWGIEYRFCPTKEQKDFARFLSSLGVDIVIGNHPHVISPIELINNTLVIYSLGNFLSAQKSLDTKIGLLISLRVVKHFKPFAIKGGIVKSLSIDNITAQLLYTYSVNNRNFKVYPFSKINDTILPHYKYIRDKYMPIVLEYIQKTRH